MKRMNLKDWIMFICTVIILAIVLTPLFAQAQVKEYQAQISIEFDHGQHPTNMANGGYRLWLGPDEGGPWPTTKDLPFAIAIPQGANPSGTTAYRIEDIVMPIDNPAMLSEVTRYIVLTAYDAFGAESDPSNEVTLPMKFVLKSVTKLKVVLEAVITIIIGQ